MNFTNEDEMNEYLRIIIKNKVFPKTNGKFILLKSDKAFDIPICREGDRPKLFFLELKCHQSKHGRLGVGHGYGGGFQVEILKLLPDYFLKNLKWILAYPEMSPDKYLFLNTTEIRKNISGGEVGNKYNNIKISIFRDYTLLNEEQMVLSLVNWLQSE